MARFLTPLRVELLPADRSWWQVWRHRTNWRLLEPLVYETDVVPCLTVTVVAGDTVDFASVPRLPVVHVLAGDSAHRAAAIHDRIYRAGGRITAPALTRRQADAIFYEAMGAPGPEGSLGDDEPDWRRWIMWAGVRIGGWAAWGR